MRSSYALALALSAGLAHAQTPFQRVYPMTDQAWFTYGGTIDAEGHFFFVQENTDNDVVLSRIAPDGEHLWTRSYPLFTEEGFYGKSIVATDDGVLVAGYTMGLGTNARDGFLMKFDLEGNIVSQQRIDAGSSSNAYHSLHKGTDGFFASGRATGPANYDMLLARIEEDGTTTWSQTYGGSTNPQHWDWARSATQLSDGGYVIVGFGDGIGTTATSGFVVRTDADGNALWSRVVSSGVSVEDINAVVEGEDGDIYLGGRALGFIIGDVSAFLVKLNSAGDLQWTRVLERGVEVAELHPGPDGGVTWLARPQYLPDGAGGYEVGWGQMDAAGNTLRMRIYGDVGSESADNMEPLPGGGWAIFGQTNSHRDGNGNFSPFLLVIDAEGNSDCWEIHPDMEWVSATAVVTPFTSSSGEGFLNFPMTTGTVDVTANTNDPCCATVAGFSIAAGADPMTWSFTNSSTGATSYTWDFGDGNSSNQTSPGHTYAQNGNYTVCLSAIGECGTATACEQVSISVGIAEGALAAQRLMAFPVPANEQIVLRSPDRIRHFQLLDADGRTVLADNGDLRNETLVPVQALPSGVYVVEAVLGNDQVQRTRVVVAH